MNTTQNTQKFSARERDASQQKYAIPDKKISNMTAIFWNKTNSFIGTV